MKRTDDVSLVDDLDVEANVINIIPEVKYQKIEGFGGTFTEAAAVTWNKLGDENKQKVLELYFDTENGSAYNLGRVHMNSCDFSLGNYSCVSEGDETLDTFNIDRDKQAVVPVIKAAMKYNDIDIMVSPWSPPPYMKTNGQMNEGGKLKKEYYELWSQFYVKFIEKYRAEGISVNRITVQNEPKAVQTWDSCVYTADEEAELVKKHLGEKMKDIGVGILFWDHNKERIYDRSKPMMDIAADLTEGAAFHWYSGDHFEQLEIFHKLYPEKKLFFSEGCYEYSLGQRDTTAIGEKYAHDMIGNFNNYCNGFYDWNLLLNKEGGPNHVGNFCDAPIMADTANDKLFIHDSYYYIKHFSRFVKRGAARIASSKFTDKLDTVSFENPDGSIVTIVLNSSDECFTIFFRINGEMVPAKAEPHSIATYIFE
ncbi:MAG: glycoside hydrolase family 30 beta sandwich domain-containing protein [Candidatus Ornithomonoglobus sp.]